MPILISFYMPAGSILNLRAFVNRVTTHCIESALFAVWVQNLYSLDKNMLYFHLLQALPSPETIRRKDFQFETLKTWQECYEIWFSFFHCLMFSQERFNTWHECSERLGNLRSGFKDIAAWLDSAQHQLKVCFCLSICKRLKDRMYFTLKIFVVVRCPPEKAQVVCWGGH